MTSKNVPILTVLTVARRRKAVSIREHLRTGWHSRRDLPRGIRIQALEQSTTHWWKIRPKLHLLTLFLARMMVITTMLTRQPQPAKTRRMVADIFLCSASSSGHVRPFLTELELFTLSIVLTRCTVLVSWGTRWRLRISKSRSSKVGQGDILSIYYLVTYLEYTAWFLISVLLEAKRFGDIRSS